jgi:hypothetical protein
MKRERVYRCLQVKQEIREEVKAVALVERISISGAIHGMVQMYYGNVDWQEVRAQYPSRKDASRNSSRRRAHDTRNKLLSVLTSNWQTLKEVQQLSALSKKQCDVFLSNLAHEGLIEADGHNYRVVE